MLSLADYDQPDIAEAVEHAAGRERERRDASLARFQVQLNRLLNPANQRTLGVSLEYGPPAIEYERGAAVFLFPAPHQPIRCRLRRITNGPWHLRAGNRTRSLGTSHPLEALIRRLGELATHGQLL